MYGSKAAYSETDSSNDNGELDSEHGSRPLLAMKSGDSISFRDITARYDEVSQDDFGAIYAHPFTLHIYTFFQHQKIFGRCRYIRNKGERPGRRTISYRKL